MKTIFMSALCLFLLIACSDDSENKTKVYDSPELASTPNHVFVVPTADDLESMENLTFQEIPYGDGNTTAYPLDQFIDIQIPQLYAYELMSDDDDGNWTPRDRGLPELKFEVIREGFLLPHKQHRAFFPEGNIAGTYNVKSLGCIRLYRNIEVIKNGTVISFQIDALPTEKISYQRETEQFTDVNAIPLSALISNYVTTKKDNYTYLLKTAIGDEGNLYSWDMINNAYIVDEQVLFIAGQENMVTASEEHLLSITLVEDARF